MPPRTTLLAAVLGLGSGCTAVVNYVALDPPVSATCDPAAPPGCRVVPTREFAFVYSPTDGQRLHAAKKARTPRSPEIVIQWCVEPARGRLLYIEIIDDAGAPELATELVEQMRPWRSKPARVDGQSVFACSQILFEIEFTP